MYRHFALVTLAATAMMALFSNGEARQAVAAEVAKAPPPRASESYALVRRDGTPPPPRYENAGADFDASFGMPTDRTGAASEIGGLVAAASDGAGEGLPEGYTAFGVTAEAWAAMSPAQQQALIARRKAEQAAADAPERRQQIDALMAASRARAGGAGAPAD